MAPGRTGITGGTTATPGNRSPTTQSSEDRLLCVVGERLHRFPTGGPRAWTLLRSVAPVDSSSGTGVAGGSPGGTGGGGTGAGGGTVRGGRGGAFSRRIPVQWKHADGRHFRSEKGYVLTPELSLPDGGFYPARIFVERKLDSVSDNLGEIGMTNGLNGGAYALDVMAETIKAAPRKATSVVEEVEVMVPPSRDERERNKAPRSGTIDASRSAQEPPAARFSVGASTRKLTVGSSSESVGATEEERDRRGVHSSPPVGTTTASAGPAAKNTIAQLLPIAYRREPAPKQEGQPNVSRASRTERTMPGGSSSVSRENLAFGTLDTIHEDTLDTTQQLPVSPSFALGGGVSGPSFSESLLPTSARAGAVLSQSPTGTRGTMMPSYGFSSPSTPGGIATAFSPIRGTSTPAEGVAGALLTPTSAGPSPLQSPTGTQPVNGVQESSPSKKKVSAQDPKQREKHVSLLMAKLRCPSFFLEEVIPIGLSHSALQARQRVLKELLKSNRPFPSGRDHVLACPTTSLEGSASWGEDTAGGHETPVHIDVGESQFKTAAGEGAGETVGRGGYASGGNQSVSSKLLNVNR